MYITHERIKKIKNKKDMIGKNPHLVPGSCRGSSTDVPESGVRFRDIWTHRTAVAPHSDMALVGYFDPRSELGFQEVSQLCCLEGRDAVSP